MFSDNRNDMTYRYMPRITHEAVNNMNLSVETFFVLRLVISRQHRLSLEIQVD